MMSVGRDRGRGLDKDSFEGAIIDERQNAERAIVDLVDRDVAEERSGANQGTRCRLAARLFFPRGLDPVLDGGKERKPDGPARGANWPCDRACRPQSPVARPSVTRWVYWLLSGARSD